MTGWWVLMIIMFIMVLGLDEPSNRKNGYQPISKAPSQPPTTVKSQLSSVKTDKADRP